MGRLAQLPQGVPAVVLQQVQWSYIYSPSMLSSPPVRDVSPSAKVSRPAQGESLVRPASQGESPPVSAITLRAGLARSLVVYALGTPSAVLLLGLPTRVYYSEL